MNNPWNWFKSLFARSNPDPRDQQRFVMPYQVAGIILTPDESLSLSAVWACISIISSAIGGCRWNVYQPTGPHARELLYNDPLYWTLNTRPNPDMTAIGFRESLLLYALPFGNSYCEVVRDGANRVAAIWPLEPDRVQPRRDTKSGLLVYEYTQPNGETITLAARDVLHFRGPGLGGLMGENIIARAAKSLAVAAAQERHSASFFGQGANPGGVLEFPHELSQDAYDRLKADWAEKKKGPENAHKPMILEGGVKWTANQIDPQKSQLVEGRQFSVEEICRWFNVPPHKVQHLLRSTFSNIEHQSIEFVRDTLTPWCRRLEQEVDFKLFPQTRGPWRYTCIDTEPLTEGDAKSKAEADAIWRQNGIKTANEIRERRGMNGAGPDGDVLLVQSNLTTVERIVNPPEPAQLGPGKALPPGEDDPELDPTVPEDDAEALARRAVVALVTMALDRHANRLAARREQLGRQGVARDRVEGIIRGERDQHLTRLYGELVELAGPFTQRARVSLERKAFTAAADHVALGGTIAEAAERALPS